MKDWSGNRNSIFKTLGASNHTDEERELNDYYATDPVAAEKLLELVSFHPMIWECACGEGHLSEVFKSNGYKVISTDLIDRGYGIGHFDFLKSKTPFDGDIITNPPYKLAQEFVEHALSLVPDGNYVAMFLKLTFLEGKKRGQFFKDSPPRTVFVSRSRILCAKNAEFEKIQNSGGSAVAYAWFLWEKGYKGKTEIQWFN